MAAIAASSGDLTQPSEPVDLGSLEDISPRPTAVASSSAGPVVVGQSGLTGFVWTGPTGIRPWVTNRPYLSLSQPFGISSDGTQVVGSDTRLFGTNYVNQAVLGTLSDYGFLDSHDKPRAFATAISPSGNWVCGIADLMGVIWDAKGHPRFLTLGTNIHLLLTITDSGVAGGVSPAGGVIYEGRGRALRMFDDWWSENFAQTPLPAHVRRITQLHEHEGQYYVLAEASDATYGLVSLLLIFPSSALDPGKGP